MMPYLKKKEYFFRPVDSELSGMKLVYSNLFIEESLTVGHPTTTYTNVDEQEFGWAIANGIVDYG